VCGRAAEIAIFRHGASEESLLARDVLDHLGEAVNELRSLRADFAKIAVSKPG